MTRLVSELTGADLARWVARAQQLNVVRDGERDDAPWAVYFPNGFCKSFGEHGYRPEKNWEEGGPIIERANISLHPPTSLVHRCGGPNAGPGQSGVWSACTWTRGSSGKRSFGMDDHSPLVAAMRCYVRYVFGDTVLDEVVP